jgi:hypothetical protein
MKNNTRFFLGVLSGLLLSVGLVGAADRLDPLSRQVFDGKAHAEPTIAPDCHNECDIHDPID